MKAGPSVINFLHFLATKYQCNWGMEDRIESKIDELQLFLIIDSKRWMLNIFGYRYMWWYHLVGLIWTSEFILACQQMVISGAVATWYFSRYIVEISHGFEMALSNDKWLENMSLRHGTTWKVSFIRLDHHSLLLKMNLFKCSEIVVGLF